MKGLALAEDYYDNCGKPMLDKLFEPYLSSIAVGLVGMGSECFGYDDDISQDHDFGPGFCLWLPKNIYKEIGSELQCEYERLPNRFKGFQVSRLASHGQKRVGVFEINEFYSLFLGTYELPLSKTLWLQIPEYYIAAVTNGKVFLDDLKEFSQIRKDLLNYYPEDVRLKKIAAKIKNISQSGQYNYGRSMRRNEFMTAYLAINIFINNVIELIYLLNKKFMPFYKWKFRGIEESFILYDLKKDLLELINISTQDRVWKDIDKSVINYRDTKVVLIEKICVRISEELYRQNLIFCKEPFLDFHVTDLLSQIEDPEIRSVYYE